MTAQKKDEIKQPNEIAKDSYRYYLKDYFFSQVKSKADNFSTWVVRLLVCLACLKLIVGEFYVSYFVIILIIGLLLAFSNSIISLLTAYIAIKKDKHIPVKFLKFVKNYHHTS